MSEHLPKDAGEAPVARLAASQLKRVRRIVDAAGDLAEKGGFEGVRLRDVAEASGVALGTLYKYFRSKEDILLFAVNEEAQKLEVGLVERPVLGDTPNERLRAFFSRATRGLLRRPAFAKAVLRAIASGNEDTAIKVASFHLRFHRMIVAALRGEAPRAKAPLADLVGDSREQELAMLLSHIWFAALVGWSGGLHSAKTITDRVHRAAVRMEDNR